MSARDVLGWCRRLSPAVVLAGSCAAIVASGDGAHAQSPRPKAAYASVSASASELPSADPPAASGSERWVPRFDVEPIPTDPSPRPSRADWKAAPVAREARVTDPGCRVQRIREWFRINCTALAIQLTAGTREGVEFGGTMERKPEPGEPRSFDDVWVVFPVKRGDRRVFQTYRWSRWSAGEPDAIASEQWLDGDPLPLITVQGIRWGF